MSKINDLLIRIEQIVNNEVTKDEVSMILKLLEISFPLDLLVEMKLYGDYLPKNHEVKRDIYIFYGKY